MECFAKNKRSKDGLSPKCRACKKEYDKGREGRGGRTLGKKIETELTYSNGRKIYPGTSETRRVYRQNHKEERALYNREHQCWKKWSQNNKEKRNVYLQKRQSLKKNLPSTLTPVQWEYAKSYFDNKCAYCGEEKFLTQDHLVPLKNGGEYTHNNIIPACQSCNSGKHTKSFFSWYPKFKHYSPERETRILKYLGYSKSGIQQLSLM